MEIDTPSLLIYGAAGYTGRLIAEEAARAGLDFAVAGRDRTKIDALAQQLGVPGRVFGLEDPVTLRDMLSGTYVVLNVAGPFGLTAAPLIDAES